MDEAILATAHVVSDVNNHWQVTALLLVCVSGVLSFWIHRTTGNTKKQLTDQVAADAENRALRKEARDKQIADLHSRITGVEKWLKNHSNDNKLDNIKMNERLLALQDYMQKIDIKIERILTLCEERHKC